jgi:hypothetical protein
MMSFITNFFKSTLSTGSSASADHNDNRTKKALSLFDTTHASLRSWRGGSTEYLTDDYSILSSDVDRLVDKYKNFDVILAFPPCVDLCVAGARWWRAKRKVNPNFQQDAVDDLRRLHKTLKKLTAPFAIVLPSSGQLRRLFPNAFVTSPHEFGGWLNDEEHPLYPLIVPKHDAYRKRTLVVLGNGMRVPKRKPVQPHVVEKALKNGKVKRLCPLLAHRKGREARRCPALGLCRALLDQAR